MKLVIYFFVVSVTSAYARVAISDQKLPDISVNNLDNKDSNIEKDTNAKSLSDKLINNVANIQVTTKKTCEEELDNNIDSNQKEPCRPDAKVNNGTALILTPFIEQGRAVEARNTCRVDPELFLGVESYAGYITVNQTYNSNIFFWYFPIPNKSVNETPWIIWLQGGPGASSMTGLFDEIGPFKVSNGKLIRNPYTWLQNHSLVFIDNPVGTGYSFTDHPDGLTKDMATYAKHLHTVVKQLVQIFPELRVAPLYVAGESYAGKYVPALAMEIHKHKNMPGIDVNLQGLMLGNAYVDPSMIVHLASAFYFFGLLEKEQLEIVKPLIEGFQQDIAANRSVEAKAKWTSLIVVLLILSHQKHAYNFLRDDLSVGNYATFLERSEVKRAIHVGDINFTFVNITVNSALAPDFLSTTKPMFETLLEHYKVLAYCGQLDQMLSCVATSENYRTWRWKSSKEFIQSTRYPYIFNDKLAGYYKSGGGLTTAVVRGAGHMVPVDAPAPAQALVARWTSAQPLAPRNAVLEGTFIRDYVKNHTLIYL